VIDVDDEQLLLTIGEAARLLRLSRTFTYDLAAQGELPVIRFGRRVLISREALERYLLEKTDDAGASRDGSRQIRWRGSVRDVPTREGLELTAGAARIDH
jgi:excisionase family DNA binding protein